MIIAGVDEVGRGPLAGPVVAAAVTFKEGYVNPEIRDSKKLSARARERLIDVIKRDAVQWSIAAVGPRRIERLNIREATRLAMELALRNIQADLVLIDGNMGVGSPLPQRTVIGGDDKHVEIAAASILAKVYRDDLMNTLDRKYPGYCLARNAGYPTAEHRSAVARLGACRVHRRTFAGVKEHVISAQESGERGRNSGS